MKETQEKEIREHCYKCKLAEEYQQEKISLEDARTKCSNCHFGKLRIYKFDIILQLFCNKANSEQAHQQTEKTTFNRTGKKETYTKRYGTAIAKLRSEGKSVRAIADILGISPTSVVKVSKLLREK